MLLGKDIIAISALDDYEAVALRKDGTLQKILEGSREEDYEGTYIEIDDIKDVKDMEVVSLKCNIHIVILKRDGTVWTYKDNLATGNKKLQAIKIEDITAISKGNNHIVALKKNGTVWAWGDNEYGQLGNGRNTSSNDPVQVIGLNDIVAISARNNCTIALKKDETVWSWGRTVLKREIFNDTYNFRCNPSYISNKPVQLENIEYDIIVKYQRWDCTEDVLVLPKKIPLYEKYYDLSTSYYKQGKYERAEPLHEKALAIEERYYFDIYTIYNSVALKYCKQKKYGTAEYLYKKVLSMRENVLGLNHPDTAQSYNNLAFLYDNQGKYEEAEPLYKKALAIREEVLGVNHPSTKVVKSNLEYLQERMKK